MERRKNHKYHITEKEEFKKFSLEDKTVSSEEENIIEENFKTFIANMDLSLERMKK